MDKVIAKFEIDDRVLEISLQEFLEKYNGYRLVICHVTEEEFLNMESQIRSIPKKLYERVKYINKGYDDSRVLGYYDEYLKEVIYVDYNNPECKRDINDFNDRMKVYTTKTYDEIVNQKVMCKLPRKHRLPVTKIL